MEKCCPKCNSINVDFQVFQEEVGSVTKSKTKSKYKEKRHGIIWWICVGWWWWIVDVFLWFIAFIPMALLRIGRKKKYKGKSSTKTNTKNVIKYKTKAICKDCGYSWNA